MVFRDLRVKLFGKLALQKNADLRFDLVHDRARLGEWTWGFNGQPFFYSDNTTVSLLPRQNTTYASVAYVLRFR